MDRKLGDSHSGLRVLVVDDELTADSARGRATRAVIAAIREYSIVVVEATTSDDGWSAFVANPDLSAILIDWDLHDGSDGKHGETQHILSMLRSRNEELPVFLLAGRTALPLISLDVLEHVDDYIWILEDTPDFIAGRIEAAARAYHGRLLPPFFAALAEFARIHEYSWHTPGHTGGTAFLKSPAGQVFHGFFGEELFRSDLSISVGELGSLLDHSGVIGEAERYAAKVFGADRTYFVTNGTSTSNKVVLFGTATRDDVVLVDRNCHKSIEHALTMTGSIPVYLMPSRNRYGIIGPIHQSELDPARLALKISQNTLIAQRADLRPVLAIVTNSTYDGLCYDVGRTSALLGESVDRIHYDEAWFAYARFNPLYHGRYGMSAQGGQAGPTIFATQSTHKLLAALSQASFVHVKQGRAPIDYTRFNEGFMMHTSTSPLYPIIASNDISVKMMEGASGRVLTTEAIDEAIAFRKTMARIGPEIRQRDSSDWWFGVWQPDEVVDPQSGHHVAFADAPDSLLRDEANCWTLKPGDSWHGFADVAADDGYCLLDPIKVTVLTPGVASDGSLDTWGIPAPIVSKFLDTQGIVVEKTGGNTFLVLFSIGVTRGKWGTLIAELLQFKRHFLENTPLDELFPDLVALAPAVYKGLGLANLCERMHTALREGSVTHWLSAACDVLPTPAMTGAEAYRHLVRNEVERVAVDGMANRVAAVGVVPYPPGIPLLMPGERAGGRDEPILRYLRALEVFDRAFPGFAHDIHGVEDVDGAYMTYCMKEGAL